MRSGRGQRLLMAMCVRLCDRYNVGNRLIAGHVHSQIQRVICRLLAIHADMKKKATLDYIWRVAEELVPESRAGHWKYVRASLSKFSGPR